MIGLVGYKNNFLERSKMKTEFTEKQINDVMKKFDITRKSAIRKLKQEAGYGTRGVTVADTAKPNVIPPTMHGFQLPPTADVKAKAANDDSATAPAAAEKAPVAP